MCYTRRKIEGGVEALRESDDANFLKPDGQSRNLNIYDYNLSFGDASNTFWFRLNCFMLRLADLYRGKYPVIGDF